MSLKRRLTSKITRQRLRSFLQTQATDACTLEIGAKNSPYRDLFPNAIETDIAMTPSLDIQVDGHHLPIATCSIPVVLCIEVLEHCINPLLVVDECLRVLLPGTRVALQIAARATMQAHWLIREEYADIGKHAQEEAIMASRYYLVAEKGA